MLDPQGKVANPLVRLLRIADIPSSCILGREALRRLVNNEDTDVKPYHLGILANEGVPFTSQTKGKIAPTNSYLSFLGEVSRVISKVCL